MIDLPWGPKIVHIHQYHEVETLLQPKTRKKIICLTSAADSIIIISMHKKQSNFAAFPKNTIINLTIENSNNLNCLLIWSNTSRELPCPQASLLGYSTVSMVLWPVGLMHWKNWTSSTLLLETYSLPMTHNGAWGQGNHDC